MPVYRYSGDDGTYIFRNEESLNKPVHGITFKGHTDPTEGTVGVKIRQPGAPDDLIISIGTYDFADLSIIEFVGNVSEWHFEVSGVDTDLIETTIVSTTTAKASSGGGVTPEDQAKLDAITDTGSGKVITNAERTKLSGITDIGSGKIITDSERSKFADIITSDERAKLASITDVGSGKVITDAERTKLDGLSNTPILDALLEGIASGFIYAKTVQVG